MKGRWRGLGQLCYMPEVRQPDPGPLSTPAPKLTLHSLLSANGSPAWKSMPTAREVPDTGTRASDLSLGSRGIPRIPSCTEYRRKEPTPEIQNTQA